MRVLGGYRVVNILPAVLLGGSWVVVSRVNSDLIRTILLAKPKAL